MQARQRFFYKMGIHKMGIIYWPKAQATHENGMPELLFDQPNILRGKVRGKGDAGSKATCGCLSIIYDVMPRKLRMDAPDISGDVKMPQNGGLKMQAITGRKNPPQVGLQLGRLSSVMIGDKTYQKSTVVLTLSFFLVPYRLVRDQCL